MKKTNVMIEVSEEVYDNVVSPCKKRKEFGRLVAHLLQAYYENDSINSYINGAIDKLEDEATDELLKDLNNMQESLSMLNMLGSQAESIIDNGAKDFERMGEEANKETSQMQDEFKHEDMHTLTREDVVEIVNGSITDIKDMLKELLSGKVVHEENIRADEVKTEHQVKEVEEPRLRVVESKKEYVEEVVNTFEEVSEEDQNKAQDALSSLLGSISF